MDYPVLKKLRIMKLQLYVTLVTTLLIVFITSSFFTAKHPTFSGVPPTGRTGATNSYCNSCHAGALNFSGGNVQVSGLPSSIVAGVVYNFSLTISHSVSDRQKWGFSIVAKNSAGVNSGSFSTTNPNAAPNFDELSHNNAVATVPTNNFTYNNLKWTAPAILGPNDGVVTFYYVGNAANGNGANSGDFIYAGTQTSNLVLPVTLSTFEIQKENNAVLLKWRTENEMNTKYFSVQRSSNGVDFKENGKVNAAGFSNLVRSYTYTDNSTNDISGTLYYRLVTVDADGTKQTSAIKKITLTSKDMFVNHVHPSIAKPGNIISFNLQSTKRQTASVAIILADGKVLQTKAFVAAAGVAVYNITLPANASSGMVYVSVVMDGKRQQVPILVSL